jgi:hypothetical protein
MKTSLEIINKLSDKEAVKLDSQLVELGLVDDIVSLKEKTFNASKTLRVKAEEWNKLRTVILGLADTMNNYNSMLEPKYNDFVKKAKELGVPLPTELTNTAKSIEINKEIISNARKGVPPLKLIN